MCAPVVQGYGLSETCGSSFVALPAPVRRESRTQHLLLQAVAASCGKRARWHGLVCRTHTHSHQPAWQPAAGERTCGWRAGRQRRRCAPQPDRPPSAEPGRWQMRRCGAQAYTQTVGSPLPLLEARLESVPEMGYDALAAPPRGELLIRGPVVFQGYYRDEAATREARPPWLSSMG